MSSCDSYDCLDVVLENVVMNVALSRDEGCRHTSTQSDPPFPCNGDSTHLKLRVGIFSS